MKTDPYRIQQNRCRKIRKDQTSFANIGVSVLRWFERITFHYWPIRLCRSEFTVPNSPLFATQSAERRIKAAEHNYISVPTRDSRSSTNSTSKFTVQSGYQPPARLFSARPSVDTRRARFNRILRVYKVK